MQVRILFFGVLKDLAGQATDSLSLPSDATLREVFTHYERRIPLLIGLKASIAMSVNQEYATLEAKLKDGDEIALLPPVSGGLDTNTDIAKSIHHAEIVREKIDTQQVLDNLKYPEDGAAVAFEGVVRNNTRGRRTLYLDYEAYEEMALKQLESLSVQALSDFKIRDVAIVHRLGRIEIGETSVLIVVASAHRAAAFDACRWLIDTLKKTVPIWKKEYFEDGAVWADGEPFPPEIPKAEGTHSERPTI
ncbi:MAG TPA: molybdenum cofactor biosynthesis protein MoaE [Terriglobales bacterium]|nr:molybdenum cofactor biosynthesis protein MoaE [Terriglobales bacterium]